MRLNFRSSLLTLLIAAAATLAPWLRHVPAIAQPLPDRAAFSGRVVDAAGRPIGGAAILLRRQNEQGGVAYWGGVAATDARGNFDFPDAEAGLYYISIDAGGFASIQNYSVTLPPKTEIPPFRLLELATFRVKLTDPAGASLPDTGLNLLMRGVAGSGDVYPRLFRSKTDANGEASFPGLVPGRFDLLGVSAGKGYFEALNAEVTPGVAATPAAWKLVKGGMLNVTAHDLAGKPLGGGSVFFIRVGTSAAEIPRATPGPDMQIYSPRPIFITRDGDGLFTVSDLAPGRYSISLVFPGVSDIKPQTVNIASGATVDVDFKFAPPVGISLTATLSDAKDASLADTDVFITLIQVSPAPISTAPVMNLLNIPGRQDRRAHTDANGVVVLYPVAAGTYQIGARRADLGPGSKAPGPVQTVQVVDGIAPLTFKLP